MTVSLLSFCRTNISVAKRESMLSLPKSSCVRGAFPHWAGPREGGYTLRLRSERPGFKSQLCSALTR